MGNTSNPDFNDTNTDISIAVQNVSLKQGGFLTFNPPNCTLPYITQYIVDDLSQI